MISWFRWLPARVMFFTSPFVAVPAVRVRTAADSSAAAQGTMDALRSPALVAISRAEWRWVVIVTLCIVAATYGPLALERTAGPADLVHVGTYVNGVDFSVYLAAMHEGARSASWLIHDHFTAEPNHPVLMFPLYVAIGKLAAALGRDVLEVYGVVELAMRLMLGPVIYLFIAMLVPGTRGRRVAFALAALGGSAAAWVVVLNTIPGLSIALPGEPSVFSFFLAAPHLGLGLLVTLLTVVCFAAAYRGSRGAAWLLPLMLPVGWLINPYNLPALAVGIGAFGLVQILRERRALGRPLVLCSLAVVPAMPLLLYNALTFNVDPFWRQVYSVQNAMPSAPPWRLPLEYGVLLLLAPLSIWALRQQLTTPQRIALAWLGAAALLMYLPVPYQRRFASAVWPALAAFAVLGWPTAEQLVTEGLRRVRLPSRLARPALRTLVVATAFFTPLATLLVVTISTISATPAAVNTIDRDSYTLGQWIGEHSGEDDVVLASYNTGNVLAGFLPGRVVAGHDAVTYDSVAKKAALAALFGDQLSSEEVRALLAANHVTYVVVGAGERAVGPYDPGLALGLPVVARVGSATAYSVPREGP